MCDWWPTNDKRTEEKKSSERSCFSHATVSYCICKENGLLIDPHTRRLMHMHALRRAHIRTEHTQKWCFCVGSSCDGRDARQQWHFCCHKQFSFHNRKNQIQTEACQQLSEGAIYFIVNDTCPQITVCDKCSAVQPKASRAQVALSNFIPSLCRASFSLTHTREGVINILCLWLHN